MNLDRIHRGLPAFVPVVERATRNDFAAIGDLNVMAYREFARHLAADRWEDWQRNLRRVEERARGAEIFICRDGERVVGSVAYCPAGRGDPAVFAPNMAAVLLLAVHPAYRGTGIAKLLMDACLSRARNDGAQSVGLFTSEPMLAAQHIYRSLGFALESELPRRYGLRYFRFVLALDARR